MTNYCVCAGCKNSTKTGHRLHGFPKDKATLRQWVQFVRVRRAYFSMTSVTANTKICSTHFKEEDYDQGDARMASLGLKTERLAKLIPTTSCASVRLRVRLCTRTSLPALLQDREAPRPMLIDASQQETVDSVDTDDPLPSTCDTGTQCNLKPLGRSHAVQVNLKPKMVSVGTQTTFRTQTSTPLTSPEQTDDDDPSVISDSSWVPGGHISDEDEEEPSHTCDPHQNGIDKFIVCQEELMSLFALCPACCEKSDSSIVQQEGTCIKIEQVCASCVYHRFWQNLLSGAIHFTGCLATQTLRMLTLFGLQCISVSISFCQQRRYTIPVIIQAWQNDQAKNFSDLRAMDGGIVVAGDCRACAKYGSYSLIEDRVNKVVDVQLVQGSPTALGLGKALDIALKDRQCDQLMLWRPAIVNHLYCSLNPRWQPSCDGGQMEKLVALMPLWRGINMTKSGWNQIQYSSVAAVKLESIITRTSLLKDVRHLEAYHFLILHFVPKHTGFSYLGTYSRLLLAAKHYNYNSNRETARRSDGTEKYCVRYPCFRKGAFVVRPIKEKASYSKQCHAVLSYFDMAHEASVISDGDLYTVMQRRQWRPFGRATEIHQKALQEVGANLSASAPAPIAKSITQIPKEEDVSLYLAQQSRFNKAN
ncbi:hypothetical protein N1851_033900 [Merluccius polli]|uniref:THAP-type domain-containing protein n=1 Tax=Merluccius polli TaxID=89951 RepID=A0AA47M0L0_MERPO|nr:hypothetical protein N1851_033900 [Merluccius polli]